MEEKMAGTPPLTAGRVMFAAGVHLVLLVKAVGKSLELIVISK